MCPIPDSRINADKGVKCHYGDGPTLDTRGVATQPAQRGDAPIAVNQNQTLAALQNFDRRIGYRNTRDNLAAALDRTGDPLDRARLSHAGAGKA